MGVAVFRIWKRFIEKPELQRDEALLIAHLVVYTIFILMFLVSMIFYLRSVIKNGPGDLDSWWYICTTINNVNNAVN